MSRLTDIFPPDDPAGFKRMLDRARTLLVESVTIKVGDAAKLSRTGNALGFSKTTVRRHDFDYRMPENSGWAARMSGYVETDGAVVVQGYPHASGKAYEVSALSIHDLQTVESLEWLPGVPYHPLEALAREADDDPQADLV